MSAIDKPILGQKGPKPEHESEEISSRVSKIGRQGVNKPGVEDDEASLIEAAREDRAAFGLLYDKHVDKIYHYVLRRVGDENVAEDITMAVWERALSAIERYEFRGVPFVAWLYRIAGNQIANHHRKRRLRKLVELRPDHATVRPTQGWDERASVREAMRSLSLSDQEVLSLYYYAGLTPPEIAEILSCSIAAVHKRLHRARNRLKARIEGEVGDITSP